MARRLATMLTSMTLGLTMMGIVGTPPANAMYRQAAPGQSEGIYTTKANHNCEENTSYWAGYARFNPYRHGGAGLYRVKMWITWDKLGIGGQWRERDQSVGVSNWTSYDRGIDWAEVLHRDRTGWGRYAGHWRVHVVAKLYKSRLDPRKVAQEDKFLGAHKFEGYTGGICFASP